MPEPRVERADVPADRDGPVRATARRMTDRFVPDVRVFSSAADAARPRRPNDVLTFVLALATLVALVGLQQPGGGPVDRAAADLTAAVAPGLLEPVWDLATRVLVLWPMVLLLLAAGSRRRWAVVRDGVLSAACALGLVAAGAAIVGVPWPGLDVLADDTHDYPSVAVALATAVIVAFGPHLGRPLRRAGHVVLGSGLVAVVATGAVRPSGALAGLLIGVVAGRGVLVVFGSPGGLPTPGQVARSLRGLGVDVTHVEPAATQVAGTYVVQAVDDAGPIDVTVVGRDARDAALMARLWRQLWYRTDSGRATGSRLHQVERDAFVTLLARQSGVPVPQVVTAGEAHNGDAVLVTRPVGRPLGPVAPIRPEFAADMWRLLDRLHDAGLVHAAVDADHLGRTEDGQPCFVSVAGASTGVTQARVRSDEVQLLTLTSVLMDVASAVRVAHEHLGDELVELLPYVQPAVLSPALRQQVDDLSDHMGAVATAITARTDVERPELVRLRRVTWGSVLQLALFGLAGYALVVGLGGMDLAQVADEIRDASVPILLAAFVVSQVPRPLQAVSTEGACPSPLPFGPLAALQFAISYVNLAVPSTAARVAVNIRFFQRVGVDRTTAVAVGALDGFGGFVVQMGILLVVGLTGSSSVSLGSLGASEISIGSALVVGTVVVVAVAVLAVAVSRRLRTWVVGELRTAAGTLRVLRDPSKLVRLVGGNLLGQLFFAAGLSLCVRAMGAEVTFVDALMANTLVSLFAGLLPVPGGIGVSEAGLTAALVAAGVPDETAFAAVIVYRVMSFYLPPVWGFFALRWLERGNYL